METAATSTLNIRQIADDIIETMEKDREREIITRRFGLLGRKETLEEIGNLLGITRERVRQIEKQALEKLQKLSHPHIDILQQHFTEAINELGKIAPLHEVAGKSNSPDHAHVNFLAHLVPGVDIVNENDHFHHSLSLTMHHDLKTVKQLASDLVASIKSIGKPATIDEIASNFDKNLELNHIHGIARSSKRLATLDGKWGLSTWPEVNPRSIRDKVYVVLCRHKKPMHFNDIAKAIKDSAFQRRDVTTQAIHNELIKDQRFVLVGRGIYALNEWGYTKGTVADVITNVLKAESPLHRDEIIERVLQQRHVKPTTIILNLQGKEQFERVAKATYTLKV